MSAFVVPDAHLQYLLNFANVQRVSLYHGGRSFDCSHADTLDALAGALLNTNIEAVNARYQEHAIAAGRITWQPTRGIRFDLAQVLKACDCFDYQACELDTYETTLAAAFVNAVRAKAISRLPGYEAADWTITELPPKGKK